MKIYEMRATFGKLEGAKLTLRPGLNIIEAPNEWGKITWCAFLLAMLYGLDTRAKTTKTALADKERYAPWSGSPMSGRVDLCWQGRNITIERTTRGRIPMGEFRAYETDTGLTVPELTAQNCGQLLLGVEQSVFRRAGFLRLADLPVTQDDALRRRLNALVTTGDESGDGEQLARALKDLKNRIRYNRTGLLPQAEAQRDAQIQKMQELDSLEQQCRSLQQQLSGTKAQLTALENHKTALAWTRAQAAAARLERARSVREQANLHLRESEQACGNLPDRAEAERKLSCLQAFLARWEEAREADHLCRQPPEAPEIPPAFRGLTGEEALAQVRRDTLAYESLRDGGALWVFGIAAVVAAAGAGALAYLTDWAGALCAAAVAAALLGAGIYRRQRKRAQAAAYVDIYGSPDPLLWQMLARKYEEGQRHYQHRMGEFTQSRDSLDSRLASLEREKQALCGARSPEGALQFWQQVLRQWEALDRAQQEASRAEEACLSLEETVYPVSPPAFPDELTWTEGETQTRIHAIRAEQRDLLSRLGQLQGRMEALGDRALLAAEQTSTRERIRRLEETYDAVQLALETAEEARRELQRRFAPRIAQRAAERMAILTDGRYDRLQLREDLTLLAGAQGEQTLQSTLWRSDGTMDQLYLALRLAVAEELTPHAPLILDDALVRFDDRRLASALKLLQEMAQQRQVILFTCQSREKELLE